MDRLKTPPRSRPRSYSAEAERRLRPFLRGFGIADDAALREIARRLGRVAPGASAEEVNAAAGLWFADLLGWPHIEAARALAAGRVAWLAADAGRRWPLALLADSLPMALVERLRRSLPALPPADLDQPMPPANLSRRRLRQAVLAPGRLRARHV